MIHKFHFNESVVGLLSATDFFYNTIDFSTGEIRKNKKDFFLCLDIVERVATNKNKKKLLSARALREIKTEYHPLFKAITDNQILLIIKKSTRKSATQVELNPLFVGECELELTQAQLDLVNVRFIKEKRRGTKATTAKEITIEITYFHSRKELELAEKLSIIYENPIHNKVRYTNIKTKITNTINQLMRNIDTIQTQIKISEQWIECKCVTNKTSKNTRNQSICGALPRYSANVWIKNGKEYWRCKKDGSKTPITKLKSSMTESEFLEYVRNK